MWKYFVCGNNVNNLWPEDRWWQIKDDCKFFDPPPIDRWDTGLFLWSLNELYDCLDIEYCRGDTVLVSKPKSKDTGSFHFLSPKNIFSLSPELPWTQLERAHSDYLKVEKGPNQASFPAIPAKAQGIEWSKMNTTEWPHLTPCGVEEATSLALTTFLTHKIVRNNNMVVDLSHWTLG